MRRPQTIHVVKLASKLVKWKRLFDFQQDVKAGMTYDELMAKWGICSRTTIARMKKREIPENVLAVLDRKLKPVASPLGVGKVTERDRALDAVSFIEGADYLGFKLFPIQRIIIKAFYGIALDPDERAVLLRLKGEGKTTWREGEVYNELVVVGGMKGGKTPLAASIVCFEEFELWRKEDYCGHYGFPAGEEVFIINVATDKLQARDTIFADTEARIKNSQFYRDRRKYVPLQFLYEFENGVKLASGHSNSRSLVGRLAKLVLFDELSRFVTNNGDFSGKMVYESLTKSVAPFGMDGKIVTITSPIAEDDFAIGLYNLSQEVKGMLGFWLATWEMNPNLSYDCPFLTKERQKDPEAFWRDYGAKPSAQLEAYYQDKRGLENLKLKMKGRVKPYEDDGSLKPGLKGSGRYDYYLHLDPAVNNCGFGIGLAHSEKARIVVDLAYRFKPDKGQEIDYDRIGEFLDALLARFPGVRKVTYDSYMAVSLFQRLKKRGLEAEFFNVSKEVHDRLKEQINLGLVDIHCSDILLNELEHLQLVSGKKIEPGKNHTKDMADGVAGAVWHCTSNEPTEIATGGLDPDEDDRIRTYRRGKWAYLNL